MSNPMQQGMQLAACGLEFAVAVLLLTGIGYLLDGWLVWSHPFGIAGGALLGFCCGMYMLIKRVQQLGEPEPLTDRSPHIKLENTPHPEETPKEETTEDE